MSTIDDGPLHGRVGERVDAQTRRDAAAVPGLVCTLDELIFALRALLADPHDAESRALARAALDGIPDASVVKLREVAAGRARRPARKLAAVDHERLDAHEVFAGIWVGGAPRDKAAAAASFSHVVLCSEGWQWPAADFAPAVVLHCPFEDEDTILGSILTAVFLAARAVAEAARAGGRVLVSCAAGRNRSALVAGLAMRMLGEQLVVEKIRARRRGDCLTNTCFRRIVTGENRQVEWFLGKEASCGS